MAMQTGTTYQQNDRYDAPQSALVRRCEGDFVWVEAPTGKACQTCASKGACGSLDFFGALFSREITQEGRQIRLLNTLDAQVGDEVLFDLPQSRLLQGTLLVYLFPLLALFVGAFLGRWLGSEVISVLMGCIGLGMALFAVKRAMTTKAVRNFFTPVMLKRNRRDDFRINITHSSG